MKLSLRDRRVWLGALLLVWAWVLWSTFGPGSTPEEAHATVGDAAGGTPSVPAAANVPLAAVPASGDPSQASLSHLAGDEIRERQREAAALPFTRDPFVEVARRALPIAVKKPGPGTGTSTDTEHTPPQPAGDGDGKLPRLTAIIGRQAAFGRALVEVGQIIPGTDGTRLLRIGEGHVEVESAGGEVLLIGLEKASRKGDRAGGRDDDLENRPVGPPDEE